MFFVFYLNIFTFENPVVLATLGCTCELQNPSHFVTDISPLHVLFSRPISSYSSKINKKYFIFFILIYILNYLYLMKLGKKIIPFVICTSDCNVSQFSSSVT